MSKLKWIITAIIVAGLLVGCSSDDEGANVDNTKEVSSEKKNNEDSSTSSTDQEDSLSTSNEDILKIGETGKVESNFGYYEMTLHSFKLLEDFHEEKLMNDVFIVVDFSVKNVGEEPLRGEDVYWADLFDDQDLLQGNEFFDSVKQLPDEIAPGDTAEGEFVFDTSESEFYRLVLNYGALDNLATSVTWEFTPDEAN